MGHRNGKYIWTKYQLNTPETSAELSESRQVGVNGDDAASIIPPKCSQGPLTADRSIILV